MRSARVIRLRKPAGKPCRDDLGLGLEARLGVRAGSAPSSSPSRCRARSKASSAIRSAAFVRVSGAMARSAASPAFPPRPLSATWKTSVPSKPALPMAENERTGFCVSSTTALAASEAVRSMARATSSKRSPSVATTMGSDTRLAGGRCVSAVLPMMELGMITSSPALLQMVV